MVSQVVVVAVVATVVFVAVVVAIVADSSSASVRIYRCACLQETKPRYNHKTISRS